MREIFSESWLGWAIGIAVGLPLILVVLTEVHSWLVRQDSRMARPVAMLRNFIIPALALLLLLTQASGLTREVTVVRVVATIFAFLLMLFILSGINLVLFGRAEAGSWRRRLPSIFIDIGRLIIVAIGLAVLFSQVWGADVGGLFAALGVTSIVIGLALQNAVGSIIAGLLLLFEQPFTLGDYLETSSARGRVVEVNWRAVHIDTGNGIQIIPNSALATSSFANLSQPTIAFDETLTVKFAVDDSPADVCALLEDLAGGLPVATTGSIGSAHLTGPGTYDVTLHLANLVDAGAAKTAFLSRLWYASRRAGLRLDGADPSAWATSDRISQAAQDVASSLHLTREEAAALVDQLVILRYGPGETLLRSGETPNSLGIVVSGHLSLGLPMTGDTIQPLSSIESSGYVNPTALTREPTLVTVVALVETVVLEVPVSIVYDLVQQQPSLARDISEEIDRRRELAEGSSDLSEAVRVTA